MKIIERYVFHSFLLAFSLAWLVLSFVLTIGLLVKITRLLIEGVPAHTVGLFMLIGFPETLTLTIPLALLVSALLVFSRLSADSEIAAMRSCGVNLLSIMKYPMVFAGFCTLIGLYVNNEIVPRAHEVRNNLKALISVEAGLELLEPGRMIDDFEKVKLYFERKEGNWLYDLLAFDSSTPGVTREIKAEKALVSTNGNDIVLDMYKVRVDPIEAGKPGVAVADRFRHVIPEATRRKVYVRKEKDFRFFEMRQNIADLQTPTNGLPMEPRLRQLSLCQTLFQRRLVEACAGLCFVLIGVPLGIKAHRKDSTLGMGISLIVAMAYYLVIILTMSIQTQYMFRPDVLVWLPVAVCLGLASILIPKNL